MLKFIGTGSAFNTKLGNNSAYIKEGNTLFLIDCGSANFHIMKESGILDDVEYINVYVTHTHADHVGSLADLIFYMYYCKGELKPRVTVYSVGKTMVDLYLKMNGITKERYEYQPLVEGEYFYIKDFNYSFIPIETCHVTELYSYGLLIENINNGRTAFYTGDTNYISPSVDVDLRDGGDLDFLYVDTCSQDYEGNVHLSLYKLHQTIKKEHRDKVWCMHLDEKFDKELAKSLGFNVAEVEI